MYMHQEDPCDMGLALGLSCCGRRSEGASIHDKVRRDQHLSPSNPSPLEPSLTLSLSDDTYGSATPKLELNKFMTEEAIVPARLSSPHSTVSSFSSVYASSIKKEKDMAIEEEKASWRVSDEEEDGGARKKLRLTKEQSALLEDRFKEHSSLNPKQKQALAKQLNLRPRQVEVWFQNRRARTKLKQTEVDCEFLKRCYESLTDENRRLQKELQELRALKFSPQPPLYMQLPAATLSMCPSCERISGGGGGGGGGDGSKGGGAGPFVMATKPRFFNPFTNPAAC